MILFLSETMRKFLDKRIILQMIQFATILVHNLRDHENQSILYLECLVNSRFYYEFLVAEIDLTDEEVISGYAALIKGLAVNLPEELLRNLLVKWDFSLFRAASMLMFYPDTMVNTSSRTVLLRVLKLGNSEVNEHIMASRVFADLIVTHKGKLLEINRKIREIGTLDDVGELFYESVDFLYYLHDLFGLKISELDGELAGLLLRQIVLPVLIGGLASECCQDFSMILPASCYILSHIFYIFESPEVLTPLLRILLSDTIGKTVLSSCYSVPKDPCERFSFIENEETMENPIKKVLFHNILQSGDNNWFCLGLCLLQSIVTNPQTIKEFSGTHAPWMTEIPGILLQKLDKSLPLRTVPATLASRTLMNLMQLTTGRTLSPENQQLLQQLYLKSTGKVLELLSDPSSRKLLVLSVPPQWELFSKLQFEGKVLPSPVFLYTMITHDYSSLPTGYLSPANPQETITASLYCFFLFRALLFPQGKDISPPPLCPPYSLDRSIRCYVQDCGVFCVRYLCFSSGSLILKKPNETPTHVFPLLDVTVSHSHTQILLISSSLPLLFDNSSDLESALKAIECAQDSMLSAQSAQLTTYIKMEN